MIKFENEEKNSMSPSLLFSVRRINTLNHKWHLLPWKLKKRAFIFLHILAFFFFLPPVSIFLQLILYQKEFHFMLQGTVPLSPTISEHSAHSVPWTGWPLPDQAVCSVRPGTEQFFKLWTGCKQHLPKKSSKETKEPWRECWRWPPFSSRCGSEIHPPTPHRDELEARWGNQLKAWSWSPTCPPPPQEHSHHIHIWRA